MTTSPLATNCSSHAVNSHVPLPKIDGGTSSLASTSPSSAGTFISPTSAVKQLQPNPPLPPPTPEADLPKLDTRKTVTTLMGGRGYINWRRAAVEKQRTAALAQINNYDAFLVIWEMKL